MYFPYSEEHGVYLQQDSFLDKELITVADLDKSQRPINQNGLGIEFCVLPYIKQGRYVTRILFLRRSFYQRTIRKHFDFTNRLPFTKVRFRLVCIRFKRQFWVEWNKRIPFI